MKHLFTIPPEESFLDQLAAGLWQRAEGDTLRLAAMRILLPTHRACLLMRDAFLRLQPGGAMLLPRLQPLADIDDEDLLFADASVSAAIPAAIAPLRRRLLLARLIRGRDAAMPVDQAAHLAEALAKFLDEAQIRRCDFSRLSGLVQQRELAEHWQETVRFLGILTEAWPAILADEGCLDPAERRDRIVAGQITAWQAHPPDYPIIAAGSTGTVPATADLLHAIAAMPQGAVVLPGLDTAMDEEAWQAVDELHPQYGMKELLGLMGVERDQVRSWHGAMQPDSPRAHLLREAMRPAAVTDAWRHLRPEQLSLDAVANLTRCTFAQPQEEAQAIGLMLRRALMQPDKTVALVTPDRDLAERVAALLARWGIDADDSAGQSLATTPLGGFLAAVLDAAAPEAGSVAWLSLLKHPLAACGLTTAECRARARHLEVKSWRSDRPETSPWLDSVKKTLQDLTATWRQERPLAEWIACHLRLAELIAQTDTETGADRLWQGAKGDAATAWLDEFRAAAADFIPVTGATYQTLFAELLRQASYRPVYGRHPRLHILGPLEARLLRWDYVVLGGCNEGVWPPAVPVDPWMSRPMKQDFGMGVAEHRIGLSAHDFVQLASAGRVVMTRSTRSGGAPTVPSRFLLQLETVLRALGYSDPKQNRDALMSVEPWQDWARLLDEPPAGDIKPCTPPEPRPPVELRPTSLSVTEIGTWQRNPYAIYARHVLGLRKLDPLEAAIDAADRGNLIHAALEEFVRAYPTNLPPDALEQLLTFGKSLFDAYDQKPEVKAFWWPRFENIAAWFVALETERRAAGTRPLAVEASGTIILDGFTLKGRADRIDRMADGSLAIVDYKTGGVPTKKEVEAGIEPQLPLLALIAARGGFDAVTASSSTLLAYWKLSGGASEDSNKPTDFTERLDDLMQEAERGLQNLIAAFADPATAYQAVPKPGRAPRYDDYAHLARLAEWGRSEPD